jgi:hypothetical protein
MATIADDIGTWEQVGTVDINYSWTLAPDSLVSAETFRFTYVLNWDDWNNYKGYRSFALMRFFYPTSNIIIGETKRLYPKQYQEIKTYIIPEQLKAQGIILRDLSLKKVITYRRILIAESIPWQLKIEYLL